MMMERMNTDIYALKKQYARIKRRQQQQAMQLYVRTGGRKSDDIIINTQCSKISYKTSRNKCSRVRVCKRGYRISLGATEVPRGSDRKLDC